MTTSNRASLTERVTGAMFWNSILLPVKAILGLISGVIVIRSLSQTEYAAFGLIIALLTTVGTYSDLGVENSLQKFLPEIERRFGRTGIERFLAQLLLFKFAILTLVLIVMYFAWDQVATYFRLGAAPSLYLIAIALLLVLGILSDFSLEFLMNFFHRKATNSMDILYAVVQPILVIIFISLGWGVPGVLYARVLATLAHVLLGFRFSWQVLRTLPPGKAILSGGMRIWTRFTRTSAVSYFSNLVLYFSDQSFALFMLAFFGRVDEVAPFKLAYATMVAQVQQFLVMSVSGVPFPLFARLYAQKDYRQLQLAYASLTRFMTLLLVPTAVGFSLLAPNLIRLLFQSRYESAASVTIILVAALFGESLFHPAQVMLLAFEENRIFLSARLITILSVPLLFIYIPAMGANGAALAIGLPRLLSRLYASLVAQRKFKLSFPTRFFFKIWLASGLMALLMLLVLGLARPHDPMEALARTVIAFVVGAGTFAIAFKALGSIEPSDRERLGTLRIPFKRVILGWL